ncbi:cytochrome P450 [Xylaria cubensis]|nr:cytochrome P450 [Xylaria cubensis]
MLDPTHLRMVLAVLLKTFTVNGTKCTRGDFDQTLARAHFHLADVVGKSEHALKRKVLLIAYALSNLKTWEHKITDEAWANFFTRDAIADVGLTERFGFLGQDYLVKTEHMDGTQLPRLPASNSSSTNRHHLGRQMDDIVYQRTTQRLKRYQKGEELNYFFRCLMKDKEGRPQGLGWGEIVAEVSIMMNAGFDTTVIAMNNAMCWLLRNPDYMANLCIELDAELDDDVVAPYDNFKHTSALPASLSR